MKECGRDGPVRRRVGATGRLGAGRPTQVQQNKDSKIYFTPHNLLFFVLPSVCRSSAVETKTGYRVLVLGDTKVVMDHRLESV